ncbi:tryptophan synthase subunit beta like protein [Halomonas organivorans]
MYVQRDDQNRIRLVSRESTAECREYLAADSPELLSFLTEETLGKSAARFHASDLAFVRVLEDVIALLMDKGVISFTELPEAAQDKVMERQSLRRRLNGLQLVAGKEDDDVI